LKGVLKRLAKRLIDFVAVLSGTTLAGRYLHGRIVSREMARTHRVVHGDLSLEFAVPNALNEYRAETFSTKEPETLAWIDSIPRGSVFWDIGANVGLYTCYAAKHRDCLVVAFEPSVFNLELLARNIHLNTLTERVTIFPLPLSSNTGAASMNLTTTDWGGALSTFGQEYGYDGKALKKVFEFRTLGIRIDDVVSLLKIPEPDFIKIDVDGIEHLVLAGGAQTLSGVKGVLIEINDDFEEQAVRSRALLEGAGLVFREKYQQSYLKGSCFENTANQIWFRQ
jgi:FkbM family methyltransferase